MESDVHLFQMYVLLSCLRRLWRDRTDFFTAGNLSIYYPDPEQSKRGRKAGVLPGQKKLAFRGPDFFVVLGARPKPRRNSWVVENEGGKFPDVIVEILSKGTEKKDRGEKKAIYEKIFRTPEYFLFHPFKGQFEGYRLARGRYVKIEPDENGHLFSQRLGLALGVHDEKLRFFDTEGALVPLPEEAEQKALAKVEREAVARARAERERARAEQEKARAEQEKARAEQEATREREEATREREEVARLRARLLALGIDPD